MAKKVRRKKNINYYKHIVQTKTEEEEEHHEFTKWTPGEKTTKITLLGSLFFEFHFGGWRPKWLPSSLGIKNGRCSFAFSMFFWPPANSVS